MKNSHFENFAKGKINGHDSTTDNEMMWAKVEAELYPESNRKLIWFWSLSLFALCSISIIAHIIHSKSSNRQQIHTKTTGVKATQKSKPEKIYPNSITKLEAPANKFNQTKSSQKNNILNSTDIEFKQESATTPINRYQLDLAFENVQTKDASTLKNKENLAQKIKNRLSRRLNNNGAPVKIFNTRVSNNAIQNENNFLAKEISTQINKKETKRIDLLPILILSGEEFIYDSGIQDRIRPMIEALVIDDGSSKKWKLGLHLSSGVAFTNTTLDLAKNNDLDQLRIRSQSETDQETLDFDIGLNIKHKSGLYLNTGINYRKTTRSLQFQEEVISMEPILGILSIRIDPNTMDPSFVESNLSQNISSQTERTFYNTAKFINIPLQLGYQYKWNAWSIGTELGALFNINTKQEGFIQKSKGLLYNLDDDHSNWFKNKINLGFTGTAFVGYNFYNRYQFTFGPYINTAIKLSERNNPINQNQSNLGLKASIKYWLH